MGGVVIVCAVGMVLLVVWLVMNWPGVAPPAWVKNGSERRQRHERRLPAGMRPRRLRTRPAQDPAEYLSPPPGWDPSQGGYVDDPPA